jgi:DNA-binding transcriptional LysR family regulator
LRAYSSSTVPSGSGDVGLGGDLTADVGDVHGRTLATRPWEGKHKVLHYNVSAMNNVAGPMAITLEWARALDALDRAGTLVGAAAQLHKGHTAVLYALGQLEAQTGLALLDRRGYRLRLTGAGRRVLEHARRLLAVEAELVAACHEMRTGWEPDLRVVYDGVVPDAPLLRAVGALVAEAVPTRLRVSSAFLGGVEAEFDATLADLMVAVVPPLGRTPLVATRLPPITAHLVCARAHPLARRRGTITADELAGHVLLTVRGGDPRLELPTDGLPRRAAGGPERLPRQALGDRRRHRLRLVARRADPRRPGPRAGQADRLDPGVAPPLRAAAVPPRPPRPGGPAVDRGDRLRRPGRWRAYTGRACRHHRRPVACACGSGSTCGCPRCTAGWCWRCC